jgi:hypothetical protein
MREICPILNYFVEVELKTGSFGVMEINVMNAFLGGSWSAFIALLRDKKRGMCEIRNTRFPICFTAPYPA